MSPDRQKQLQNMLEIVDPSKRYGDLRQKLESQTASPDSGPQFESRRSSAESLSSEATKTLESLDVLQRGGDIDSSSQYVLEAIVMPYYRPVVDVVENWIVREQLSDQWTSLGDDARKPWIEERTKAVGRIDVPNVTYAGTGFVVGDGLLMTNRHVAAFFAQGIGKRVALQPGQSPTIDFYHEVRGARKDSLKVKEVVMIHPYWDMALLKVEGLSNGRKPLELSVADPTSIKGRNVVVIGYPGYDPYGDDEYQRVQSRVFRNTYYVKRFQPGTFRERAELKSYERLVSAVTHDCSTLGGNSGSAVIDLETGQVVGLHFAGEYLKANYAVSPYDLAQDSHVVDAGVNFKGRAEPRGDFYGSVWGEAEERTERMPPGEAAAGTIDGGATQGQVAISNLPPMTQASSAATTWTVPLYISLQLGAPPTTTAISAGTPKEFVTAEGLFGRSEILPIPDSRFRPDSLAANQYDWQTALSLALASRLSYANAEGIETVAARSWGLKSLQFIEQDDTQCFVASTDSRALVAFRGTESLGDWLSNLNVLYTTRSFGKVHRGFLAAFEVVEAQLRQALTEINLPVVLTGHSLGGALATIAAAAWNERLSISHVYTYGQPAVGKGDFQEFMTMRYGQSFFRFVNGNDIVPRVPPTYQHVGILYHLTPQGRTNLRAETVTRDQAAVGVPMMTQVEFDRMRAELLERRIRASADGRESLETPVPERLIPSVSDHNLDLYLARIATHF